MCEFHVDTPPGNCPGFAVFVAEHFEGVKSEGEEEKDLQEFRRDSQNVLAIFLPDFIRIETEKPNENVIHEGVEKMHHRPGEITPLVFAFNCAQVEHVEKHT